MEQEKHFVAYFVVNTVSDLCVCVCAHITGAYVHTRRVIGISREVHFLSWQRVVVKHTSSEYVDS